MLAYVLEVDQSTERIVEFEHHNDATGNTVTVRGVRDFTGWTASLGASCGCGAWHEAAAPIMRPDAPLGPIEAMLDDALSDLLAACRETCGS